MKNIYILTALLTIGLFVKSQTTNDILNVLVRSGTLKQGQVDSLRADASIKQQEEDAKKKLFQITSSKALQIGGYGHMRYQHFDEDGKVDGFDIRRAYVDIKGAITPYLSYRMQTEFASSPKIIDVYAELKINEKFNFTIGQQLLPVSLNNITSNTKLVLADRSQVVEACTSRKGDVLGDNNGRDIGISVFGSFLPINDLKFIEYRLGVFNGSGINKSDLNDAKDLVGRIVLHPIKGLDLGGSFISGWTPDSLTINNKTASEQLGKRQRLAGELSYTYKIFNLTAEYIAFTDGKVEKSGYYAQLAAFVLPNKIQVAGRYDSYDMNLDISDNISTNITLGVNYFINQNATLQVAYTFKDEEGSSIDNNFAALQLQITF
ncbi:MAG: porin [Salinivirgaceae bacterium]|jgi:hypothetical protein